MAEVLTETMTKQESAPETNVTAGDHDNTEDCDSDSDRDHDTRRPFPWDRESMHQLHAEPTETGLMVWSWMGHFAEIVCASDGSLSASTGPWVRQWAVNETENDSAVNDQSVAMQSANETADRNGSSSCASDFVLCEEEEVEEWA